MKRAPALTSANYSFPDPGELNKRVAYRKRISVPGDSGTLVSKDLSTFETWTKVRQTGAATYQGTVQTDTTVTHYLTIRYRTDISSEWEAVVSGEVMRIRRIRDLNSAGRFLLLECESKGAAENYSGGAYG
ncbi:phage head closure protein [Pantoea sp. Bo_2]|uniref:Phage head closure protein n=1 Tax=Candidatus Pantoea gossypiicola TaxID=2608008 RepID=A0AB34CCP3_9GAMM|nr:MULTISPECIES: phage head closure protein [Pantoea]KAA5937601.1 phage head closure protein [Pantoea sp. VH_3]KAA5946732.1 phage head closure protein [Pantoea sp. VH_25]KAA5949552.1 phage head closure protein [Pantoea sp. VH_24]KAA5957700.1 phage head closure protein [Pantoea sp. VH_16]KAA5959166.1 phage head closure protein [Pantoea sp. VH_18]